MKNYCLQFDGTVTSLARITPASMVSPGLGNFSYSVWFKALTDPPSGKIFGTKGVTLNELFLSLIDTCPTASARIYAKTQEYGVSISADSPSFSPNTNWHNCVVTCERGSLTGLKLYLDAICGVETSSKNLDNVNFIINDSSIFNLGSSLTGFVDDFRFYKGVILTQSQINYILNSGRGRKVVESGFKAITDNGYYANLDEGVSGFNGRLLTDGIWADAPGTVEGGATWMAGGVPILSNSGQKIFGTLQSTLENNITLAAYIKQVLLGARDAVTEFPCIIIEPLALYEKEDTFGARTMIYEIAVCGYLRVQDKESQIVGDGLTKGMIDFENDVKEALLSNRNLDSNAIDVKLRETSYSFAEYPIRGFALKIEVMFREQ